MMAAELMEIDFENTSKNEIEDGEIAEDISDLPCRVYENNEKDIFTTGIDIFSANTQEKLNERAKRFNIDPSSTTALTDAQINELYSSLGITQPLEDPSIRFDAVHLRGTEEMSTEDVFQYFKLYGPATIEWINDYSCNVVWLDKSSAARALKGMSNVIEDVASIQTPMPPGFWRLGSPWPNAKELLMRYATTKDKKCLKAEKASHYYKKYGNPNYGGLKGVITDRKRKQFYDNTDNETGGKKNPWGDLSRMWADSEDNYDHSQRPNPKISQALKNRIGKKKALVNIQNTSDFSEESDNFEDIHKRIKIPRMKMYADEEEKRLKKLKPKNHITPTEYDDHDYNSITRTVETYSDNKPKIKPDVKDRLGGYVDDYQYESDYSDTKSEDGIIMGKYGSVINVIKNEPDHKPLLASEISTNLVERRRNNTSESSLSNSDEESKVSRRSRSFSKPGFDKADLRLRLSSRSIYNS